MLEDAITLMEKQIDLYKTQDKYLQWSKKRYLAENTVKYKLEKEIKIREFILELLEEHKKEGINE